MIVSNKVMSHTATHDQAHVHVWVFGDTASGVTVKEIKADMTVMEVESVLGPPQTKIVLSEKVLYKYKDMTVEFRNGKVVDVR